MAITHTQRCIIKRDEQIVRNYSEAITRFRPVSIQCSTLPGSFFLGVNLCEAAYVLSWKAVKHPLEIGAGRISLSSNGRVVAAVDI
ncbi:hypothetical protein JCM5296_004931 [Sporobolomyces johnsonii]